MKNAFRFILLFTMISLLAACGKPINSDNIDMQVQTAIAQTAQAEAAFQVAVDQAVQATVIAMPPTLTPQPAVDPYTLTEEELADLIDASCEEAAMAYEEATSDGTYAEEEIYDTIYYVYDAEAAIAYAEELLYLYYDLYGVYASETLELLYAVEDDLNELDAAMTEVEAILSHGAETASAAAPPPG